MLTIRIKFLWQRYVARRLDADSAEVVPHPDRLFQALVSAAARTETLDQLDPVFRKMECWGAPSLLFPPDGEERSLTQYIPHGGYGLEPKRLLDMSRGALHTSHWWDFYEEPVVFIQYSDTDLTKDERGLLQTALRVITYLGTSDSQVEVDLVDEAITPNLVPQRGFVASPYQLRVPNQGRLQALRDFYDEYCLESCLKRLGVTKVLDAKPKATLRRAPKPPRARVIAYDWVSKEKSPLPFPKREAVIYALSNRDPNGVRPPLTNAVRFLDSIRLRLIKIIPKNPLIHGHGDGDHCAWVPLAPVGYKHGNASLFGFALLFPEDADPKLREEAVTALSKITEVTLTLPGGSSSSYRLHLPPDLKTLEFSRWEGTSQVWDSATPVQATRYLKKGDPGYLPRSKRSSSLDSALATVEASVRQECEDLGLEVEDVSASFTSRVPHAPIAQKFVISRWKEAKYLHKTGRRPAPWAHVTIVFKEPVTGPILLGRKRFFGSGLFLPREI